MTYGAATIDPALWLGFIAAAAVMGIIPGPGVMSLIGYAISSGTRVALAAVAGLAAGNAVAMSVSLAGVGVLLAASATAFAVLKWAGAIYLVILGLFALRRRGDAVEGAGARPAISARTAFLGNLAIGTFHPKTIVFFVAFVPQFIRADRPYLPQAGILTATFVLVVACTDTAYALLAARAAGLLRGRRAQDWMRKAGGGALIASGIATAAMRR